MLGNHNYKNKRHISRIDSMNLPLLTIVVSIALVCAIFIFQTWEVSGRDDCPVILGEDVTEQWWVHLREYPHTERSIVAYNRFVRYRVTSRVFSIDGVTVRTVKSLVVGDTTRILYNGWREGDDGYYHPTCGVFLVNSADNELYK